MAHVTGQSRDQTTLFVETLDEVVTGNHPVRVIDAFVDGLDLVRLGFSRVVAAETGRPPYLPGHLVKLYIYGYLNHVRSSRRLMQDTRRNVEVMWLINRLSPSFKTIADFRKDHAAAIVGVCGAFSRFCREQSLFGGELLAIDGTKIAAVASRKQVLTAKQIAKQVEATDRRIVEYLTAMDDADAREPKGEDERQDVAAAVKVLQARRAQLQAQAEVLARDGLKQKVVGEEEARLMRTPHGHQVAYNAQIAVDAAHHLIAACDLTSDGNDLQQLHPMAVQGKDALAVQSVTVVADVGYSNGEHGALCERDGITAIVPRAETVNTHGKQFFSRRLRLRHEQRQLALSGRRNADLAPSLFRQPRAPILDQRLRRLCTQSAVHPRSAPQHHAPLLRRRARGDEPACVSGPSMDATSTRDGRASLRHHQVAHSKISGPRLAQSQSRTGSRRSGLQSQAHNQHPRRTGIAASTAAGPKLRAALRSPLKQHHSVREFPHDLRGGP